MVTKIQKKAAPQAETPQLSGSVKDSAQQIWQAGLGAFTRAQAEGSKAFEALVKEGITMQRKTQSATEERIAEATNKMTSMANDIGAKASGQWDKLETIFEDRVAKALNKLGVPSAKDVNALIARIDELNLAVQKLTGSATGKAAKTSAPAQAAAVPRKRTSSPTTKATAKPTAKAAAPMGRKTVAKAKPAAAKQP